MEKISPEMARHLGAYRFVNTRDDRALDKLAFHFNMILVTVNAPLNWDIGTLTSVPQSQRQVARRVSAPTLEATVLPPIIGQCSFGGPPVGKPGHHIDHDRSRLVSPDRTGGRNVSHVQG